MAVIGGGCKCCWAEQFALLLDFVGFGCWCCRIVVCTVRVRHCGVVGGGWWVCCVFGSEYCVLWLPLGGGGGGLGWGGCWFGSGWLAEDGVGWMMVVVSMVSGCGGRQ